MDGTPRDILQVLNNAWMQKLTEQSDLLVQLLEAFFGCPIICSNSDFFYCTHLPILTVESKINMAKCASSQKPAFLPF
nr:hypothetical protein Iba_chr02dCG4160 [Ipomoea batatas]GME06661.1 hypothetical protein Iba_scaffold4931CG0010 [Ipomoea batatas]